MHLRLLKAFKDYLIIDVIYFSHREKVMLTGGMDMYFSILKKDLKRKKTMNCILLLFVILSVMFAASSVNNIIAIGTGLDSYFEKAGLTDLFYIVSYDDQGGCELYDKVLENDKVSDVRKEDCIFITSDCFKRDGKKLYDFTNTAFVLSVDNTKINFFDKDNEIIKSVEKGKVYITNSLAKKAELTVGDRISFEMDGTKKELEFAGILKDAFLGSEMMQNYRFLMNNEDYDEILENESIYSKSRGAVLYVSSEQPEEVLTDTAETPNIRFSCDKQMVKTSDIMALIIAAVVLVVSLCLILISFVVLKFTIGFTIAEEFREIGVMKAIGLKNSSIRALYLVKYFGISIVGAIIGFILSLPFSKALISSVSADMVLENDGKLITGLLSTAVVVMIIMLFSHRSTAKIKKLSPIDAVRNGQTGERFGRRGLMSLSKSRLGTHPFMAANDVLSSPKQYGIITLVFMLCTLLVMILSATATTLMSEDTVELLAVTKTDVYISDTVRELDIIYGKKTAKEQKEEIEKELKENGMEADVSIELWYKIPADVNGEKFQITMLQNVDADMEDYVYTQGYPPRNEHEIALSGILAKKMGLELGDKVKLTVDGKEDEYLLTALYQSFNNLGESGRFYKTLNIPDNSSSSAFAFQADFKDDIDREELERRIDRISELFECKVFDASGFVNDCTGVSQTLGDVKNYLLILSMLIIILISVLMERSFISKEKSEIALLKAMGFKSRDVMITHTLRFMITGIIAVAAAAALCIPLTHLSMDPIFAIMGTDASIKYTLDKLEIFAVIPLMIISATLAGVFFTALYTKTIKAQDTAGIE